MRRLLVIGLLAAAVVAGDDDSDRDGLSDFQERHKYFTDPARADSDGDGTPDGDWDERREYAYTIRTVVLVMRPAEAICGDYQDARLLEEHDDHVKLEVIHYPLNTVAEAIAADPDWRRERPALAPWLAPGPTANWDAELREEILAGLRKDGIDAAALDDRELAARAAAWLMRHAPYSGDYFTGYFTDFEEGRPAVHPGLDKAIAHYARRDLSVEEQWERDILAKGMFRNRHRGSCTSSAIYLNGCLRAVGLPTRIVYCIPCIDPTDPAERALLPSIRHHEVRRTVLAGMPGGSWSGHTFNEVFVGGRWHRLNYEKLGQNILDARCFGLLTHVLTVRDWADAGMAPTVGRRQGLHLRDDVFEHGNPYSTLELDDRFGAHAKIENPAPPAIDAVTVVRAMWWRDRPANLDMKGLDEESGHLLLEVQEVPEGGRIDQYRDFYSGAGKEFVLRAEGREDVPARAERGYWGSGHFYLRIAPADLATMAEGVAYALVAKDAERWRVGEDVTLVRGSGVLTIDRIVWSDAEGLPAGLRESLKDQLLLLGHVRGGGDFEKIRFFTANADPNFVLEAEGRPPVRLRAGTGGITSGATRYVVLYPLGSPEPGVEYALRALNAKPGFRWELALTVTR